MADIVSKEARSKMMAGIRCKDTKPEMQVRSMLHKMGFRFRLHRKDLPGKPDIVLPKYRAVVFVHGCFWHRHSGCKYTYVPKSRIDFWNEKFEKNMERDKANREGLKKAGWSVLTVWECQTRNVDSLSKALEMLMLFKGNAP